MPDEKSEKKSGIGGKTGKIRTIRKPRVLFVCKHNSVRSQIAEGYLRARYSDLFEAASAGSKAFGVYPIAIAVMDEIGIPVSAQRSTLVDELFQVDFDIIVKVSDCAYQGCPFFPGVRETIDADFPGPKACDGTPRERVAQFRQVHDAIITWIDQYFVPGYGQICIRP
jgi:arsenate reductase